MTRPDPNHAPTLAETQWLSSPAAEREEQERRTNRMLLVAGLAAAGVWVLLVVWVIPAVAS